MRASIFISAAAFGAAALAQSTSEDAFPQTSFLTQTNSLGVVTGQPGAATSQPDQPAQVTSIPAQDTSVGVPASIPAVSPGVQTIAVGEPGTNSTRTLVVSANNSTTVVLNGTPTGAGASGATTTGGSRASGSGSESSGSNPSPTDASASSESTGAAATVRAVAGGLVGAGAFVAAFL